MANDYSDLAKRLLQEGGDFHRACSDAIHSLALENKATHQAWKADIKACEAEVKRWKSGCEKEYTRAQVLTAERDSALNQCTELHREVAALKAQIAERDAWIADLQSGMYVNCVYCGHRYGPGETTPVSMADALKNHIEQCPSHPMSALKSQLESAEAQAADLRKVLAELVECKDAEAIAGEELQRIPYTAEDIDLDRARTVPNELRARIYAVAPRLAVAWESARAALAAPGEKGPQP